LLQKQFGQVPKAIAARIARGSVAAFDRWADRVLEAESLSDVFDAQ
jgi:hypothetical protein